MLLLAQLGPSSISIDWTLVAAIVANLIALLALSKDWIAGRSTRERLNSLRLEHYRYILVPMGRSLSSLVMCWHSTRISSYET